MDNAAPDGASSSPSVDLSPQPAPKFDPSLAGASGGAFSVSRIERSVIDGALAEARRAAPRECCGALLGRDASVLWFEPLRNLSGDPARFDADPLDLLRVEKQASRTNRLVLGHYHSHPRSDPRPSRADREERAWPDLPPYFHLIVSPEGRWVMYNTRDGAWSPIDIEVIEDTDSSALR